ncbi:adenylate cyclase type 10 [Suricata suricatta]|uniref:adenylate cyclase type 10 n=1 Tax=Suricata suricatta TaxID=37032 RepID=UPI0011559E13|nr:adenylate cyclase type 10 [Suricata suricatta]
MEGQVLYLQKQIEERAENTEDHGGQLLKDLESLVAQNTTGPVFYPRLYHLMAYEGQNCDLFLNTALQLSETQGNVLEKCWLNMNKVGTISQQAGVGMPALLRKTQKSTAVLAFPRHGRP